jgi:hypothetical protein
MPIVLRLTFATHAPSRLQMPTTLNQTFPQKPGILLPALAVS